MTPISTNIEEREQWRARIQRALAELQTDTTHLQAPNADEAEPTEQRTEV